MTALAPLLLAASPETVAEDLIQGTITGRDWLVALAILVGGFVLGAVVRRLVRRVFLRGAESELVPVDETATSLVARLVQITIISVAVVYALLTLGVQVGPLFGALGIGGIAIAFAMQDTLENFIGGLVLQLRRPFLIGDQIEVGAQAGTVIDIGFRYVRLRRFDGTVALIPAKMVLQDVVVNNTAETRRRTTMNLGIAYDADLAQAREVILAAVVAAPSVVADPAPEVLLSTFGPSSIDLMVRYWHDPQRSDGIRATDEVVERVHRALAAAGIEIPFPQTVVRSVAGASAAAGGAAAANTDA
jgi:small-conductance mechanosensitive channel